MCHLISLELRNIFGCYFFTAQNSYLVYICTLCSISLVPSGTRTAPETVGYVPTLHTLKAWFAMATNPSNATVTTATISRHSWWTGTASVTTTNVETFHTFGYKL